MSFPLQRSLLKDVHQSDEEYCHETEHFEQARQAQLLEIDGPRVHENHFHVKKDEENGHQKIFDGKRGTGIANGLNATFECLVLDDGLLFRAKQPCDDVGSYQCNNHEAKCYSQNHQNGKIRIHVLLN